MSNLKGRIQFYAKFLEDQAEQQRQKSKSKNDFSRGLDSGYESAFGLVARWLREELAKELEENPDPVYCSSCGDEFLIPGRGHGFSHCDSHAEFDAVC